MTRMQTLSIFLLSIIINACSSPDDIPKAQSNPFGYIEAGSTLNAYSKTVNDTIGIEVLLISQVLVIAEATTLIMTKKTT